jgi:uncharacterized protein
VAGRDGFGAGHYPHQAPVDAYGNFGFRFAEMSHRGSILCLPTGIFAWPVASASGIDLDALAAALAPDLGLEVFLIGAGEAPQSASPELIAAFRDRSIVVEIMGTGAAVRTYNVLLADGRAVGAALVAVA